MSAPAVSPDASRQVWDCAERIRGDATARGLWQRLRRPDAPSDAPSGYWPALAIRLAGFREIWPLQNPADRERHLNRLEDAIDAAEVADHAYRQAGGDRVPGPLAVLLAVLRGPDTDWSALPDAVLRRTPAPDLPDYLALLRRHVGWHLHRLHRLHAATERLRTPDGQRRPTALAPALIRWTVAILDEAGLPRHDPASRRAFIVLTARLAGILSPDADTQPGPKDVADLLRHDNRIRTRSNSPQEPQWLTEPALPDVSAPQRQVREPESLAAVAAARIRADDSLFLLFLHATAAQDDGSPARDPVHRFATLAGMVGGLPMLLEHEQTRHATDARARLRAALDRLQAALDDAAIPLPSPAQAVRRAALERARAQASREHWSPPAALHPRMAALLGPAAARASTASRRRPAALLDPRLDALLTAADRRLPTIHVYLHKLAVCLDDRINGAAAPHPLTATPAGRWPSTDRARVSTALLRVLDAAGVPRRTLEEQAAFLDIAVRLLDHLHAAGLPEDWRPDREALRKALKSAG